VCYRLECWITPDGKLIKGELPDSSPYPRQFVGKLPNSHLLIEKLRKFLKKRFIWQKTNVQLQLIRGKLSLKEV